MSAAFMYIPRNTSVPSTKLLIVLILQTIHVQYTIMQQHGLITPNGGGKTPSSTIHPREVAADVARLQGEQNAQGRIPKIIHLCWLSGDEYPNDIKLCLDSWKQHLPDYEVWLWDTKRFDINSTIWTKQAFENKKYAFAADYIRLYALYHYGGIYLDSDVMVYKSFDPLLSLPYFIGQDYNRCFEAAVIGAQKGMPWIKHILDHYDNRQFVLEDGSFDMRPLPTIFYHRLVGQYSFRRLNQVKPYQYESGVLNVFTQDFFNSRNSVQVRRTRHSFCAHNYAGGWTKKNSGIKNYIIRLIPKWLLNIYFTITHNTINKKKSRRYQIPFTN